MARHGFGSGEYRYFAYPLPDAVARLRTAVYPHLAAVANRWNERMALETRYPERHGEFLDRCQAAGQTLPTTLLPRYGEGASTCLHQDLYGAHVFPLQIAVPPARPGGGEGGGVGQIG